MATLQKPIPIPEPTNDVDSLWKTCQALKEAVEVFQGLRGNREYALLSDLEEGINNIAVDGINVTGSVVADNGLSWSRAIDAGVWTPASTTTDLTCTFYQHGIVLATRVVQITRAADGTLTAGFISSTGQPTSHNVIGSGTTAISIVFIHTASLLGVFETVTTVQGGLNGLPGADGSDGSAGIGSRTVNLTAGQMAFLYLTDDTLDPAENANTTITATALNTEGTPYYEFFLNDVSQQDSTSNTWTYTPQASYTNMPDKVEVHITEGGTGGTIYARDQITVNGIKPGVDAPLVTQSNEAHTIPVDNLGVHTYTGSGNILRVYLGANVIAYDNSAPYASPSFRVTGIVDTNVTAGTPTENATNITYGAVSAMTADVAEITYTIIVKNNEGIESTIVRKQSLARSNQGDDGSDGVPGLPGASTLLDYDDADTNGSSSSQGKYHFLTSITDTSGTLTWATITAASGVDYFSLHDTDANGVDQSAYFDTVAIGDTLTWWLSDRKWVSFRITSLETAPTDMYKWGITLLSYDEADGTGDVSGTAGVDVVLRFSRADVSGTPTSRVVAVGRLVVDGSVDPATAQAGYRSDSDGDAYEYEKEGAGSYVSVGTWKQTGVTGDYDVMMRDDGTGTDTAAGSSLDTWLDAGTDRTWTLSDTSTAGSQKTFEGTVRYRDGTTFEILSEASVTLRAFMTV